MVDGGVVFAADDICTNKQCENLIDIAAWIAFVEGDDTQTVIFFGPIDIGFEIGFEPVVALCDAAVVHVVVEVGDYKTDGGQ